MSFPASLLGTHVVGSPCPARTAAVVIFFQGQAEVGYLGFASRVDQDVGRFDVAVDEPFGVGVVQSLGNRGHEVSSAEYRVGPLSQPSSPTQVAAKASPLSCLLAWKIRNRPLGVRRQESISCWPNLKLAKRSRRKRRVVAELPRPRSQLKRHSSPTCHFVVSHVS